MTFHGKPFQVASGASGLVTFTWKRRVSLLNREDFLDGGRPNVMSEDPHGLLEIHTQLSQVDQSLDCGRHFQWRVLSASRRAWLRSTEDGPSHSTLRVCETTCPQDPIRRLAPWPPLPLPTSSELGPFQNPIEVPSPLAWPWSPAPSSLVFSSRPAFRLAC